MCGAQEGVEHAAGLPEVLEVMLVEFAGEVEDGNAATVGVDAAALPVTRVEVPEGVARAAAEVVKLVEDFVLVGVFVIVAERDVVDVDVGDSARGR
jgi:hypothetical protein